MTGLKTRLRASLRSGSIRSVGNMMAAGIVGWIQTLDSKIIRYDPLADPVVRGFKGPAIFVFWHEYMLVPCWARRGCDLVLLASRHRDADWLLGLASSFGYEAVRGSTSRGGAEAVLTIVRQLKGKSLVITPDGPLGPRRQVSSGCIYLSSLLGIPIVPLGCGYDRPWRFQRTWDQFACPRFGSRARIVLDHPIQAPKKLGKDGVEEYRQLVEQRLSNVTSIAEEWAIDGSTKAGEEPFYCARQESLEP